jgi:hypothetical protein
MGPVALAKRASTMGQPAQAGFNGRAVVTGGGRIVVDMA